MYHSPPSKGLTMESQRLPRPPRREVEFVERAVVRADQAELLVPSRESARLRTLTDHLTEADLYALLAWLLPGARRRPPEMSGS